MQLFASIDPTMQELPTADLDLLLSCAPWRADDQGRRYTWDALVDRGLPEPPTRTGWADFYAVEALFGASEPGRVPQVVGGD